MKEARFKAVEAICENEPSKAIVKVDAWGGPCVAVCGEVSKETMRLARLFAAAPELLELVGAFVGAYERLMETHGAGMYMDLSETFTCGNWVSGQMINPVIKAKAVLDKLSGEA